VDDAEVLLIEDQAPVRESITEVLRSVGFKVAAAADRTEAVRLARKTRFAVVLADLLLPEPSGIETIRDIKQLSPDTEFIIITGYPSFDSSIAAIREDVYDYLCKPLEMQELVRSVQHAMERRELLLGNKELLRQLQARCDDQGKQLTAYRRALERKLSSSSSFVGESEAIKQVRRSIAEIAPSDMTVLIRGETGTGKDVVARLIHELSGRPQAGNMVKVNCPAIPETLLESELFGHESGAFTGASRQKLGRFELAAGGTLFLNEIGQIPLAVQAKLLQAIEEKEFTRLGGEKTTRIDTRVLAATNAPLEEMVEAGQFRLDLFYRLSEYIIWLPLLRDRAEDIPILVRHFLRKYGPIHGRRNLSVSSETTSLLVRHQWPGNVRELETLIRRYALTGREEIIQASIAQPNGGNSTHTSGNKLATAEAQTIAAALIEAGGNQRQAARVLGVSYSSLRRKIAKYRLKESLRTSQMRAPGNSRGLGLHCV